MRVPISPDAGPLAKRQLTLVLVGLCLLLPATVPGQRRPSKPQPSPTVQAEPTPPTLEFQAIATNDNLERGQTVTINLILTNRSNVALSTPKLIVTSSAFDVVTLPDLGNSVGPFASIRNTVVLKARADAAFTKHAVVASVQYTWGQAPREFRSEQSATVTLEVKQPFSDVAPGLPGGTAALLVLLLPVILAFLGYYVVDSLRQFGTIKIPPFEPKYAVPTFVIASILNAICVWLAGKSLWLDYSNPATLIGVFAVSFAIGAIRPGVRWYQDRRKATEASQWEFNQNETVETYLRKALLSPYKPRQFEWVKIPVGKEEWEGISLLQPNGELVLGAQLTVGFDQAPSDDQWTVFLDQVLSREGAVKDPDRLLTMIAKRELAWSFNRQIARDKKEIEDLVVVEEIRKISKRTSPKACPLIIPIR